MVKEWTPNRGPFARTGCPQRATRSQTVNYQHCSARDTTTSPLVVSVVLFLPLEKTVAVNVTILLMLISGQLRIGFSFSSCNNIVTSDWTVVVRKKKTINDDKKRQPRSKRKGDRGQADRQTDRQSEKTPKHKRLKGSLI